MTPASQGRPTTASSVEVGRPDLGPANATDGNLSTRWSSRFSDPQWLEVDLGSTTNVTDFRLVWEAAYAKQYDLQFSDDSATWTTAWHQGAGTGGTEKVHAPLSARYVRLHGTQRATIFGYSLYEFQVFACP